MYRVKPRVSYGGCINWERSQSGGTTLQLDATRSPCFKTNQKKKNTGAQILGHLNFENGSGSIIWTRSHFQQPSDFDPSACESNSLCVIAHIHGVGLLHILLHLTPHGKDKRSTISKLFPKSLCLRNSGQWPDRNSGTCRWNPHSWPARSGT